MLVLLPAYFALLFAPSARAEATGVLPLVGSGAPTPAATPDRVERPLPPLDPSLNPDSESARAQRLRDRWLLSLEGIVSAPADIGAQIGFEAPFRLRAFLGFGWMPAEWLTSFAASASGDAEASAVLDQPDYRGTLFSAKLGFRPFPKLGLYVDAGYARANLVGTVDLADFALAAENGIEGGYRASSSLDLWLLEVGYQWRFGERGLVAAGLGVMSTFHAHTTVSPSSGAPMSSRISSGAERADDALESYGTFPTLTLRVGFDLI